MPSHRPENRKRFLENTMRRFKVAEWTSCVQVDAGFSNALVGVKDVFE
jgi:hypothetical protein